MKENLLLLKDRTYTESSKEINGKDLKLELVILLEYQNIKIFLQMFQIGLKKFL